MPLLGPIVNFFVVAVAGLLGTFLKKGIPKHISDGIISAMAICVIYIGIDGMLETAPAVPEDSFLSAGLIKVLIMILSMGIGTLIGELVDLDKLINRFGDFLESKLSPKVSGADTQKGNFAKGFVSCSLLFCVGAMAVTGSLQDAKGIPDVLLAKSVIDAISCFVMATTLGIGCAFSAFMVLGYQGIITLLGLFLNSIVPEATMTYMSVTGSLIIVLIGTNMLGATKVKTANMIPAIFMPAVLAPLLSLML